MNGRETVDVVILGAGIAGSCMAILLARRGWKVALLDRRAFPRHKTCGEFLSPEAVGSLIALGLEERLRALEPAVIRHARLHFAGGASVGVPLPGIGWGISRYELDGALHDEARLAGAEVADGTAVTAIARLGDGYELAFKRAGVHSALRARTAIGAWGGNGAPANVPDARDLHAAYCPYLGVKTHLTGCRTEEDDRLDMYFFDGGYVGLSSAGNGIVNAAALLDARSFKRRESTVVGWLTAAGGRNARLALRLEGAVPVAGSQAAVSPVRVYGEPLPWNGVPLIGDACVTIPPLCGDGMSMAIRSAQLCAIQADRFLRGEAALEQWETEYSAAVRRQFRGPLRWGRLLQRAADDRRLTKLAAASAALVPGIVGRLAKATRLGEGDALPW